MVPNGKDTPLVLPKMATWLTPQTAVMASSPGEDTPSASTPGELTNLIRYIIRTGVSR
jgi:hypothetical protein